MRYLLLFFLLVISNIIKAQTKITDEVFNQLGSQNEVPIILQFGKDEVKSKSELTKNQKGTFVYKTLTDNTIQQSRVQEYLENQNIKFKNFKIVNTIALTANADLIQRLSEFPEIKSIVYDAPLRSDPVISSEKLDGSIGALKPNEEPTPEWGILKIQADSVWNLGYKGEGVIVAGQDTGYDWDAGPLIKKYRGYVEGGTADHNYNWHDAIRELNPLNDGGTNPCGLNVVEPCDDLGHGTHTVGTMIGSDENNLIGVAPNAQWIGCRNMERGWGKLSTYLECYEFFLAPTDLNNENPDPTKAPHVINNSWGCPLEEGCDTSNFNILEEAVNNLKEAGIVVVVSAGNDGPECHTVNDPSGIFENSFSVGATNKRDSIAVFSSRGTVTVDGSNLIKPNVSAPGVQVRSIYNNGNYYATSGTSMAGPHVAGVVALMINARPELAGKVDIIEDIIEDTAVRKYSEQSCGGISGSEIPNPTFGYGRIDALAAVNRAIEIDLTSTKEVEYKIFDIVPNPSQDKISIVIDKVVVSVKISAVNGVYVKNINPQSLRSINVSDLTKGLYIVTIQTQNGQLFSEKLIKQ